MTNYFEFISFALESPNLFIDVCMVTIRAIGKPDEVVAKGCLTKANKISDCGIRGEDSALCCCESADDCNDYAFVKKCSGISSGSLLNGSALTVVATFFSLLVAAFFE